jgi:predicted nucleotidyltransferase component of viral defense system
MSQQYSTPQAFKMAVEQRLRTQAASSGIDLARLRQLLVFDRFLSRVFTAFGEVAVLKGGVVLELRLERARTTKDIDLRLVGKPAEVLPRLQQAGRLDLGDYLAFEVQPDAHHPEIQAEGMVYEGQRYRAQGFLAGKIYGSSFGVDVAFGEPLSGLPEELPGSTFLSFAGVEPSVFRVYPLEAHIAEKLHAYTLPRERPNSRVKDLPDIALLASLRSIEAQNLREAIRETFSHRATHPVPPALPDPPEGWSPVYERMALEDGLPWSTLGELVEAVRQFLNPVLDREAATGRWDGKRWTWTSAG